MEYKRLIEIFHQDEFNILFEVTDLGRGFA